MKLGYTFQWIPIEWYCLGGALAPPPLLWGQFSDQALELSDVTLAGEGMEQAWTPASPGLEKVFCRMEQLSKGVFHQ